MGYRKKKKESIGLILSKIEEIQKDVEILKQQQLHPSTPSRERESTCIKDITTLSKTIDSIVSSVDNLNVALIPEEEKKHIKKELPKRNETIKNKIRGLWRSRPITIKETASTIFQILTIAFAVLFLPKAVGNFKEEMIAHPSIIFKDIFSFGSILTSIFAIFVCSLLLYIAFFKINLQTAIANFLNQTFTIFLTLVLSYSISIFSTNQLNLANGWNEMESDIRLAQRYTLYGNQQLAHDKYFEIGLRYIDFITQKNSMVFAKNRLQDNQKDKLKKAIISGLNNTANKQNKEKDKLLITDIKKITNDILDKTQKTN